MGSKTPTSKEVHEQNWYSIIESRSRELQRDSMHAFDWTDRQNLIKKNMSRQDIVSIYETAYSELAESYEGMKDAHDDIHGDRNRLTTRSADQDTYIEKLEERLAQAEARVNGLLEVIEKPTQDPPMRNYY